MKSNERRISVNKNVVEEIEINQHFHYQLRSTITQKEQPVLLSTILLEATIKLGQRGLKAARGELSTLLTCDRATFLLLLERCLCSFI